MMATKWGGQEIDGYQVVQPPDGHIEIWDGGDYCIFTLNKNATEGEVRAAIRGYKAGEERGEFRGRMQLQSELRRLLGV